MGFLIFFLNIFIFWTLQTVATPPLEKLKIEKSKYLVKPIQRHKGRKIKKKSK